MFQVYLGIQLLTTELKEKCEKKNCDNTDDNDTSNNNTKLLDIVNDIRSSCSVSVNILNDLLLIDKIEEGKLILDKKSANAMHMFETCIRNFKVQVQMKFITLLTWSWLGDASLKYIFLYIYLHGYRHYTKTLIFLLT